MNVITITAGHPESALRGVGVHDQLRVVAADNCVRPHETDGEPRGAGVVILGQAEAGPRGLAQFFRVDLMVTAHDHEGPRRRIGIAVITALVEQCLEDVLRPQF